MADVRTGVDIAIEVRDETVAASSGIIGRLRAMGETAKEAGKEAKDVGQVFTIFAAGGVAVALSKIAEGFAAVAQSSVKVKDELARTGELSLEFQTNLLESVPIFGSIVAAGHSASDALVELVTGSEAASRSAMQAARSYEEINRLTTEGAASAEAFWNAGDERRTKLNDQIGLLEQINDVIGQGSEVERQVREEQEHQVELREVQLRQLKELQKFEQERAKQASKLAAAGGNVDDFEERTRKSVEDTLRQQQEELELLQRKRDLELEMQERRRDEQWQKEAEEAGEKQRQAQQRAEKERADEEQRAADAAEREAERLAEQQRREEERAAEEAAREEERRSDALRQAEGRISEARDTRGLTGIAEGFLARRGGQEDGNQIAKDSRDFLRQIAATLERTTQEQPQIATF